MAKNCLFTKSGMYKIIEREVSMKYKIGDEVTVKMGMVKGEEYGEVTLLDTMEKYQGKTFKVDNITENTAGMCYWLNGYWFSEVMLEEAGKASDIFLAQTTKEDDPVNHPSHYTYAGIEAIDVIKAFFKDNYFLGNVFKYIARAGKKGNELEDLKKAQWYLNAYIEMKEGK